MQSLTQGSKAVKVGDMKSGCILRFLSVWLDYRGKPSEVNISRENRASGFIWRANWGAGRDEVSLNEFKDSLSAVSLLELVLML